MPQASTSSDLLNLALAFAAIFAPLGLVAALATGVFRSVGKRKRAPQSDPPDIARQKTGTEVRSSPI